MIVHYTSRFSFICFACLFVCSSVGWLLALFVEASSDSGVCALPDMLTRPFPRWKCVLSFGARSVGRNLGWRHGSSSFRFGELSYRWTSPSLGRSSLAPVCWNGKFLERAEQPALEEAGRIWKKLVASRERVLRTGNSRAGRGE